MFAPWKKSNDKPRQLIKKQRHYFANRDLSSQSYIFSSSQVWMWELDLTQSWVPRNLCFWTMVLEKTVDSPFDSKEFKLVNPKGNQSWIFIGCWSWNSCILATWLKNWLTGNTLMLGKIEDRRKRWWQRMMVECRDQLDGHEFEHVLGVGDGQGSLASCSPWVTESDMTEQLNNKPLVFSCCYSQTLQETNTHAEGQCGEWSAVY